MRQPSFKRTNIRGFTAISTLKSPLPYIKTSYEQGVTHISLLLPLPAMPRSQMIDDKLELRHSIRRPSSRNQEPVPSRISILL